MRAIEALSTIASLYRNPGQVAERLRAQGHRVLRVVGSDAPFPFLRAAGFSPVRMTATACADTPAAEALLGPTVARRRAHQLVELLLDPGMTDPVLFTRADGEQAQIFSIMRENVRLGAPSPRQVTLLDLLHRHRAASKRYNVRRLEQLRGWLVSAGGRIADGLALEQAAAESEHIRGLLLQLDHLRSGPHPRLSGTAMLQIIGCETILPPEQLKPLLLAVLDDAGSLPFVEGERLFIAGSAHELDDHYRAIEQEGYHIVGESHDWGVARIAHAIPRTLEGWAVPCMATPASAASPTELAKAVRENLHARNATKLLHLTIDHDEAAPWSVAALHRAMEETLKIQTVRADLHDTVALRQNLRGEEPARRTGDAPRGKKPKSTGAPLPRSRKLLMSTSSASEYQRDWFASVRKSVAEGSPFAMVNANAPQEILRALGLPFVVNQWWASLVAAKQQSRRYSALLRSCHYPTDVEAYSAQGIAAALDDESDVAPWGGLPRPDFVHAISSSDATLGIFESWAHETGAALGLYERTVDPRWDIETRWWEVLHDRWDEALEAERIDLLTQELRDTIASIEATTDLRFDPDLFAEVMHLVNEQEDYYRQTRDLIARTVPAPIGIVDSMPATMVPQWHRGTVWARNAAKAMYEEVAARVAAGQGVVDREQVRLMWVGRGLWSNTAFYQNWEESHGAVFVWSMYLALAADGYIRKFDRGRDPMRALAARFLTMGDELRMPSWAAPWHVHEARTHMIDGAVALSDADPFVLRALVTAGIPLLELGVDNYALDRADNEELTARVTAFIEQDCAAMARKREAGRS